MKAATSLMNRGLIAHSTETVATTAVTIAGIAATSENSATNRLCSRAPARAALRAALSLASSMRDENDQGEDDEAVAEQEDARTTFAVGRIGVKPAKMRNVASASTKAAPTAMDRTAPWDRCRRKAPPRAAPMVVVVVVKTLNRTGRASISGNHRRPWQCATMLLNYDNLAARI